MTTGTGGGRPTVPAATELTRALGERGDGRRRGGSRVTLRHRRQITGLLCVTPAVALTVVFFLLPLVLTMWMSLHNWPLLGEHSFIGVENYSSAFQDETFRQAIWFTLKYTLIITPILFAVALGLALLVTRPGRATGFFRAIYLLPVVVGFASASFLWLWLVNPQQGPIGEIGKRLGIIDHQGVWLSDANTGLWVIIVMITWKVVGLQMILFMSGIQSVPTEVEEAARVDGCGYARTFYHIVLPLLRPTIALVLVFSVAGSLLAFDQFYIMTGGGPSNQTVTMVFWIYHTSFVSFRLGYGAALSVILMVFLLIVSAVQMYLLRSSTEY